MQNDLLIDSVRENGPGAMDLVSKDRTGYFTLKRLLDFSLAFIFLILLSPLMLVIAIAILIYSPGPIFFVQERVGAKRRLINGRTCWKKENFRCYKFRTMKVNADPTIHQAYVKALMENDEVQMTAIQGEKVSVRKLVHDPRLIRPGKILRKFSLDELPQFWNVLVGEMSLVGPRPAIPYEVEMYKPWQLRRLETQPGITGLQQVNARCTSDFDSQVLLDIEYINKQSFWLDVKIILQTPFVVISTKGAH